MTTTARGSVSQGSASTTNVYGWGAGAQLASSSVTQANQAPATTDYAYGPGGRLDGVSIRDGRPRTVTILSDLNGQALRRDEADGQAAQGDPHDLWYRFGGREIGHAGVVAGRPGSFAASIAARGAAPATGAFAQAGLRHGAAFVEGVDPITSYEQGADGGRYTVQAGDVATGSAQAALAGIAGRLWGDAGLWYRLAQANGLAGGAALAIGRVLTVPAGVVGSAYHAGLMRGFDPADALGDVSPVTPAPAGKAARRNRCGAFGTVLLVAVAVAVTIATGGAAAAALAPASGAALSAGALAGIGVGAGIAGSVASQGLGLATGLQDGFRWKSVALAGIAGGIGGGLGAASLGRGALGAVARGALGNALTQGVAVASGLQGRFDWAGVAVGGAVGGVAGAAGQRLARAGAGRFAAGLGAGMAGAIAGGAARSLLTGASFGDTVLATLPDAIGATIGNAVGDRLAGRGGRSGSGSMSPAERALVAEAERSANPAAGTTGSGLASVSASRSATAMAGQADDIVVTADRRMTDMFRTMTNYQFGRYDAEYGNLSYSQGAQWALSLNGSLPRQTIRAQGNAGNVNADRVVWDVVNMGGYNPFTAVPTAAYRMFGQAEYSWENGLTVGTAFAGPLIGKAARAAAPLVARLGRVGMAAERTLISDVRAISAADVNAPFLAKGWDAPYSYGSQARTFTASADLDFVRVTTTNPEGAFLVRAKEIAGMSPEQIQVHLALPKVPTNMLDVRVPIGTRMQTGFVGPQPAFGVTTRGGIQYQILDQIPSQSFGPMRPIR